MHYFGSFSAMGAAMIHTLVLQGGNLQYLARLRRARRASGRIAICMIATYLSCVLHYNFLIEQL